MTYHHLQRPSAHETFMPSYPAIQAALFEREHDPLELDLRGKRVKLLNEGTKSLAGLFALPTTDSTIVEEQRKGLRERLSVIYEALDEIPDPVPSFNGSFTRSYQKAAIALAQKPESTEGQKAEAGVIQHQNRLIAERRFDEIPKPEPLLPEETFVGFSSYLGDISRRDRRLGQNNTYSKTPQKEGLFKRAGKKLGSAWKAMKGWFGR